MSKARKWMGPWSAKAECRNSITIRDAGGGPFKRRDVGSVQAWRQDYTMNGGKRHSVKPEHAIDLVESNSPGPYLEMFARRQRLGWDTWGDEAFNHIGTQLEPTP